jgi:hypothetical protein
LHAALGSDDLELVYRAALVLTAWGDDQGLDAIEHLIDSRIDAFGINVPHRIYGYNNVYDELAYAVYLFGHCQRRVTDQKRIFSKLLNLYGPYDYESKLKHALLKTDFRGLLADVEQASQRAMTFGKFYLASQLLPVIAKWNAGIAWRLFPLFLEMPIQTPNPAVNVAEALEYIDSDEARSQLRQLCHHPDPVVAGEASRVLKQQG